MSWVYRKGTIIDDPNTIERLLASSKDVVLLSNVTGLHYPHVNTTLKFSQLIGIGVRSEIVGRTKNDISKLREWLSNANDYTFGYVGYDAKNLLEDLPLPTTDRIGFPLFRFFIPELVIMQIAGRFTLYSFDDSVLIPDSHVPKRTYIGSVESSMTHEKYLNSVNELKRHIQMGDIYEVNFCVENFISNTVVEPLKLYRELEKNSPAAFSCYVAQDKKFLISASPERFIKKEGSKIISQPMKGTNRRETENRSKQEALRTNAKERAENIMITDLVRNDLSKSAVKGTVQVDELCGVYELEHVNTMISTVSAELRVDVHPLDAVLNAFPMGSMTGAPKIRAMQLIDEFEDFARGLFSGAVGYFTPRLDFDFNVVIRSILYNSEKKVVSFPTGSAITIGSDAQQEYEECQLKAEAMRKVLQDHAS